MFLRTESEAQLVARTRKGDVEAFNVLVSRWEKRLYNYLLRLLRNREDALDLSQEAFLKAYQSIGTLAEAGKFPHWLFRIARNLAFSQLRRPSALAEAESGAQQDWSHGGSDEWPGERDWPDWDDARSSLRTSASRSGPGSGIEMELAVAGALDSLAPEQRDAILLKVYHGFLFEEIAEISSCPLSTVKSRIYAGFAKLRELLAEEASPRQTLRGR